MFYFVRCIISAMLDFDNAPADRILPGGERASPRRPGRDRQAVRTRARGDHREARVGGGGGGILGAGRRGGGRAGAERRAGL